jgi:hypothetical protein
MALAKAITRGFGARRIDECRAASHRYDAIGDVDLSIDDFQKVSDRAPLPAYFKASGRTRWRTSTRPVAFRA